MAGDTWTWQWAFAALPFALGLIGWFIKVNARLDAVTARLEAVEAQLEKSEEDVAKLSARLQEVLIALGRIDERLQLLIRRG